MGGRGMGSRSAAARGRRSKKGCLPTPLGTIDPPPTGARPSPYGDATPSARSPSPSPSGCAALLSPVSVPGDGSGLCSGWLGLSAHNRCPPEGGESCAWMGKENVVGEWRSGSIVSLNTRVCAGEGKDCSGDDRRWRSATLGDAGVRRRSPELPLRVRRGGNEFCVLESDVDVGWAQVEGSVRSKSSGDRMGSGVGDPLVALNTYARFGTAHSSRKGEHSEVAYLEDG